MPSKGYHPRWIFLFIATAVTGGLAWLVFHEAASPGVATNNVTTPHATVQATPEADDRIPRMPNPRPTESIGDEGRLRSPRRSVHDLYKAVPAKERREIEEEVGAIKRVFESVELQNVKPLYEAEFETRSVSMLRLYPPNKEQLSSAYAAINAAVTKFKKGSDADTVMRREADRLLA